jgi:hypothetical protein
VVGAERELRAVVRVVLVLVRLRYRSGAREGTGLRPRSRVDAGWLVGW